MARSAARLQSVLAAMAVWVTMGLLAPAACQSGDQLLQDEQLKAGESRRSINGLYTLVMQGDCNLVLYHKDLGATWASRTVLPLEDGKACFFAMQGDGNAVIYRGAVRADLVMFATNTARFGAHHHISVQDDGNVVMYTSRGLPRWSTNTAGK